jgi:hypothetical protein
MSYTVSATSDTPALVIYLLDSSGSMQERLGQSTRQEVVTHALQQSLQQMVLRSTRGIRVSPRYRVAIFAYNEKVHDLLDGVRTIDDVLTRRIDGIHPSGRTNTAQAFERAEALLLAEIPRLLDGPAPLVCHMTDGEYNDGPDPFAVVSRLRDLEVPDGHVLVENVFMSDQVLTTPVDAVHSWPGVSTATPLRTDYARRMRDCSSPLPQSYRELLVSEHEYLLAEDSVMMFPGTSPELVELAFQVSASTPTRSAE